MGHLEGISISTQPNSLEVSTIDPWMCFLRSPGVCHNLRWDDSTTLSCQWNDAWSIFSPDTFKLLRIKNKPFPAAFLFCLNENSDKKRSLSIWSLLLSILVEQLLAHLYLCEGKRKERCGCSCLYSGSVAVIWWASHRNRTVFCRSSNIFQSRLCLQSQMDSRT